MKWLVIAMGLWSVAADACQAPDAALPPAVRTHVQADRFGIVTSIRGLPLGVRDSLQGLFGGALDIAEPGAGFQTDGASDSSLPTRRLIAAGCSGDHHCLVYYQRGGTTPAWRVVMFQWAPDATSFEWGGDAPRGYASIEDVRKAILAGEIKTHAGSW